MDWGNLIKEVLPVLSVIGFIFVALKYNADKKKSEKERQDEAVLKAIEEQKLKGLIESLEKDIKVLYSENTKIGSIEKTIIELSGEFKNISRQLVDIAVTLKEHIVSCKD